MHNQIHDIISLLISNEQENGLTLEQIQEKYVCGACKSLAMLIKSQFTENDDVKIVTFERSYVFFDPTLFDMTFKHVCIATNLDKKGNLQPDSRIYDINGERYYKDVDKYLTDLLQKYDSHFKNKKLFNRKPFEIKTEIDKDFHLDNLIGNQNTPSSILQCYHYLSNQNINTL